MEMDPWPCLDTEQQIAQQNECNHGFLPSSCLILALYLCLLLLSVTVRSLYLDVWLCRDPAHANTCLENMSSSSSAWETFYLGGYMEHWCVLSSSRDCFLDRVIYKHLVKGKQYLSSQQHQAASFQSVCWHFCTKKKTLCLKTRTDFTHNLHSETLLNEEWGDKYVCIPVQVKILTTQKWTMQMQIWLNSLKILYFSEAFGLQHSNAVFLSSLNSAVLIHGKRQCMADGVTCNSRLSLGMGHMKTVYL